MKKEENEGCPFISSPELAQIDMPCPHFFGEGIIRQLAARNSMSEDAFVNMVTEAKDANKMLKGVDEVTQKLLQLYLEKQVELLQVVMALGKKADVQWKMKKRESEMTMYG